MESLTLAHNKQINALNLLKQEKEELIPGLSNKDSPAVQDQQETWPSINYQEGALNDNKTVN